MNKIKFSIICPVYNSDHFLNECVDSVLNQSFKNWELFLIDDGSTDKSSTVCDDYSNKYKNITVIHKQNQGQYFARIDGIKRSSGDKILFLDSDDKLDEHCLEILNNSNYINNDITVFNMKSFSDEGFSIRNFYKIKNNAKYEGDSIRKFFYFESLIFSLCRCCFDAKLFSNDDFVSLDLADSKIGEDSIFLEQILKKTKSVVTITDELYFYRMHEKSATHLISFDNASCRVKVLNHLYKDISIENEYETKVIELLSWAIINAFLYGAITLRYRSFKQQIKIIYEMPIYKRFFCKFRTESRFYGFVAKMILKHRYLILFWFVKLFKKRVK